jgi:hypothetical protein
MEKEILFFFLGLPAGLAIFSVLLAIIIIWSLVLKGPALWHSARRGDFWWFLAILIINSVGILEIIYLFFVAKMTFKEVFTLPIRKSASSQSTAQ